MIHLTLVAFWALSTQAQTKPSGKTLEAKPAYSEMFDPFAVKRPETPAQEAERAQRNTVVISQPSPGVDSPSLGEAARELRDRPCGK
ncbi:MAG TPA: hypothetical protein VFA74_19330 [Terriglobales bacterium]|nr:hypothetical protein [Terriglobales bacterium]